MKRAARGPAGQARDRRGKGDLQESVLPMGVVIKVEPQSVFAGGLPPILRKIP